MSKEAGGFAFPQTGATDGDGDIFESARLGGGGMTLRDYFAAKAMQVLLTKSNLEGYGVVAEHAYLVADRMIDARDQ